MNTKLTAHVVSFSYLLLNKYVYCLFRNTVQLVVNVEDVNDNAPVFLQSKYEARLWENHMEFESPLYIEAVDLDLNGKYKLSEDALKCNDL
jgi:hypothetical protein